MGNLFRCKKKGGADCEYYFNGVLQPEKVTKIGLIDQPDLPPLNKFESVSTLPHDFFGGAAVVLNNEIHILGSNTNNTKHYKWNGSSWTEVSTLPYGFYQGSAIVLDNEIHILGSNTMGNYTKHYKWNGSSWTEVSTLPYDFYQGAAVVLNNEIHILGSNTNRVVLDFSFYFTLWLLSRFSCCY